MQQSASTPDKIGYYFVKVVSPYKKSEMNEFRLNSTPRMVS